MAASDNKLALFELAGWRWTVPVLMSLDGGTLRFGEIRRTLASISHKQLAHTLRRLERDGFVLRTAYPSIPPRVEYQLTTLGRELVSRLSAISQFAVDREGEINEARRRYDDEAADFKRAMIMSA